MVTSALLHLGGGLLQYEATLLKESQIMFLIQFACLLVLAYTPGYLPEAQPIPQEVTPTWVSIIVPSLLTFRWITANDWKKCEFSVSQ